MRDDGTIAALGALALLAGAGVVAKRGSRTQAGPVGPFSGCGHSERLIDSTDRWFLWRAQQRKGSKVFWVITDRNGTLAGSYDESMREIVGTGSFGRKAEAMAAWKLLGGGRRGSRAADPQVSMAIPFDTMTRHQRGKARGAVLYEGPSQLDGKPIVVIMVYTSENLKTNSVPQVFIIRRDVHPAEARRTGEDRSICGGCAFAGGKGCYVNIMPVGSIYKSYHAGRYGDWRHAQWRFGRDAPRVVRVGAYGDPVAVPMLVWDRLARLGDDLVLIGYTEQWRLKKAQPYKWFCMASAKTYAEQQKAKRMGWRTFRVYMPEDAELVEGQIVCPYEQSDEVTCLSCQLCKGGDLGPDIANPAHAAKNLLPKVLRTLAVLKQRQRERYGGSVNRDPKFVFWLSCPDVGYGEIIHYLNDHAVEITYATFAQNADLAPMRREDHPAMYRISSPSNWAVSFYKSELPNGDPVYYFDWSRMEFIFVDPKRSWPDVDELGRSAVEAGY